MFKLFVCIIVLATVCCDQEHLTCLRTDDVFTQQSPQTPIKAIQGSPGKRGPRGEVGSRGSPGQKGEPGIPDYRQINLLQNQFNSLVQEMETLKNQSRIIRILEKRMLYIPPHNYMYQLTSDSQSWQESQELCQNWGGNLAVYGVKTRENRKKLIQNLSINDYYFWIGANDIASEGNWIWVSGGRASSSELIWASGEPNNYGGKSDCVAVYAATSDHGLANDRYCTNSYRGLCEKQI